MNGAEEIFIFYIDDTKSIKINLDITISKPYNISCTYIDNKMTVRIDDIRPLDTILGLIENLDGI
jgi:hypothetical protein